MRLSIHTYNKDRCELLSGYFLNMEEIFLFIDNEKMVGVFQAELHKYENIDEVTLIRKIHKNIPRKLVVSEVVSTSINEGKVNCNLKLKRAQMISVEEIKAYIEQTGERTTMKRFLNWIESLK